MPRPFPSEPAITDCAAASGAVPNQKHLLHPAGWGSFLVYTGHGVMGLDHNRCPGRQVRLDAALAQRVLRSRAAACGRNSRSGAGAAVCFLQGRCDARSKNRAPQPGREGPPYCPLALSRFLRRGAAPACKNRSAAPNTAPCFVHWTRSLCLPKKCRYTWPVQTVSTLKRRRHFS